MDYSCMRCHSGMIDAAVLCHRCTNRLAGHLADIPVLLTELDTTLARLGSRSTIAGTTRRGESVHPDMTISIMAAQLRGACIGWAYRYDTYTGPEPWEHLWSSLDDIRLLDWVLTMDADIVRYSAAAWRKIDRPPDRWYAGVCGGVIGDGNECTKILWAALEDDEITCPACRARWSVGERRAHLIRFAEEMHGSASMVASVASYVLRRRIPHATVRSWVFRGLIPRQITGELRVGDAIELAMRNV